MGIDWEEILGADGEDLADAYEASIPEYCDNCNEEYEEEDEPSEGVITKTPMNEFTLAGYATAAPKVTVLDRDGKKFTIANYTVAVNLNGKGKDADFIQVTAMGKLGMEAENHIKKGSFVHVTGSIHNNNFEHNGVKHYTFKFKASSQTVL